MKLQNWTQEQEKAFQDWLYRHQSRNTPVPKLLIRPFRKRMRDLKMTPHQIRHHGELSPDRK